MGEKTLLKLYVTFDECAAIGLIITHFSALEYELAIVAGQLAGMQQDTSRALILPLNFTTKTEIVPPLLVSRKATKKCQDDFRKLRAALVQLSELRNLVAHGIFKREDDRDLSSEMHLLTYKGGKERKNALLGKRKRMNENDLMALGTAIQEARYALMAWARKYERSLLPSNSTLPPLT